MLIMQAGGKETQIKSINYKLPLNLFHIPLLVFDNLVISPPYTVEGMKRVLHFRNAIKDLYTGTGLWE